MAFILDNSIDLSSFAKDHTIAGPGGLTFRQIRDVSEAFLFVYTYTSHTRTFNSILSCYKTGRTNFASSRESISVHPYRDIRDIIRKLVFPLSILLALVPKKEGQCLIINDVVIAHFDSDLSVLNSFENYAKKTNGQLIINQLTVVSENLSQNTDDLKNKLEKLHITLNAAPAIIQDLNLFSAEKLSCVHNASSKSPSAHVMFGSCRGTCMSGSCQPLFSTYNQFQGDDVLIAVLGYGYNKWLFADITPIMHVLCTHDAVNATSTIEKEAHDPWYTIHWLIHSYTKTSHFVVCKTTDNTGTIINGATAEAIEWLRREWQRTWKGQYNNLIILIPYGGQYMQDEMIQITRATNEDIIIVCAAGPCEEGNGGDVVFPAALGTVISVGVAGTGPKGREIDVSVNFATQPAKLQSIDGEIDLLQDCGTAAARICSLLALLLSRINVALRANQRQPHYLHTCVIRELIVNTSKGCHDPQLGYGDGEAIIKTLLEMDNSTLCQMLANVLEDSSEHICLQPSDLEITPSAPMLPAVLNNSDSSDIPNGYDINVAVIDTFGTQESVTKVFTSKPHNTTFKSFQTYERRNTHGDECAAVLRHLCPLASIWRANCATLHDMPHPIEDCLNPHLPTIDVISYSISVPYFHYKLCSAVNCAVMANKIFVFAAGNDGQKEHNTIRYPGCLGNIIVVGGCDQHFARTHYSSIGREMDFLAKGEYHYEEIGRTFSGTSYAAPAVAGFITLLLQFIKVKMCGDTIYTWSYNDYNKKYEWQYVPVSQAVHNVYAMRTLMKKLFVSKPQQHHSDREGFGCLDHPASKLREIATTRDDILKELQKFYKWDTTDD